ncbi:MAG: phosphate regulon sensor histidine kinase PhoR [Gammaproteobacteria bacterium]|nr:phosphate regulon sensor histidine kinase PhoR [Gammaproteobacteria bacterium]
MSSNPWRTEFYKIILVIACCYALYQITHSWIIAIAVVLISFIGFIGFKLHEVLYWLDHGMQDELTPESGGVIGKIISLAYRHKKTIEKSYQQQQSTVKQFTDIISAIPSATVILSQENEVEWANYPALLLLGIDAQQDIGIKIDSLIRQTDFSKKLRKTDNKEFEMISPVDSDMILVVQLAKYARKKRLLLAHNISPHIEVQRSRKTFIANASHELRTPLTVVSGYLEYIHSTPDLPDSLLLPVEKALEQSANMQVLIDDLLVLSKLENKELTPDSLTQIDLQNHLSKILQTLAAGGKTKFHKIISHVDKNLSIDACEKELDSVCYNLINNALKYSEKGSKICIAWEQIDKKQVKFSVEDNGIGIAPEHIARLTERFYRVDSGRSRRVGGTGLGLSITKHIVERHNGRMEIHSRLGEGSRFFVIFPMSQI